MVFVYLHVTRDASIPCEAGKSLPPSSMAIPPQRSTPGQGQDAPAAPSSRMVLDKLSKHSWLQKNMSPCGKCLERH